MFICSADLPTDLTISQATRARLKSKSYAENGSAYAMTQVKLLASDEALQLVNNVFLNVEICVPRLILFPTTALDVGATKFIALKRTWRASS